MKHGLNTEKHHHFFFSVFIPCSIRGSELLRIRSLSLPFPPHRDCAGLAQRAHLPCSRSHGASARPARNQFPLRRTLNARERPGACPRCVRSTANLSTVADDLQWGLLLG